MVPCTDNFNEKWEHKKGGQIKHVQSGFCLDFTGIVSGQKVKVNKCNSNKLKQIFEFENYSA